MVKRLSSFVVFVLLMNALASANTLQQSFTQIYETGYWGCAESLSGGGSTLKETYNMRPKFESLLKLLGIRTLLDAACGDFNWMKTVALGDVRYFGIDIVEYVIANNQRNYGTDTKTFICGDISATALPRVDLILCRDCLFHLSFDRIKAVIRNFKRSGSVYLLTTTFPRVKINDALYDEGFDSRPLNLQEEPLNFPAPLLLLDEEYSGKALGLWRLEDLN